MELKQNTTIVVLGASGDLAKKKTVGSSPNCPSHTDVLELTCSILLHGSTLRFSVL